MSVERRSLEQVWPAIGLALSLFVPSTAVFYKYFGLGGVLVYILGASLLLAAAISFGYRKLWLVMEEKWVPWLAVVTIVLVLVFITVMYPLANSGRLGPGSDGDEALVIAATDLLQGQYPYSQTTYLGNPISPLPGAVILSVPFVLLGNIAFQNVFWLAVFYWVSGRLLRDRRQALLLLWTILLLSPGVLRNLAVGSDYISNSIYVLVFALWVIHSFSTPAPTWQKVLASIMMGLAFSSRANFLLISPLLFFAIVSRAGWKEALQSTLIIFLSFVVMTLPFYMWDPGAFSPLHTANELGQFHDLLPAAGLLLPMLTGAVALALSLRDNGNITTFLGHAAMVLALPVFAAILLSSLQAGSLKLVLAGFGTFFLFFGSLASWPGVWHLAKRE